MATTNYTITGTDFKIRAPSGEYFQDGGLAIVQWELGYEPRYHPLYEWTGNPIQVSWTGWYEANHFGPGRSLFGSNGTLVDNAGPLYLFIDFGNSSNVTPNLYGQAWMGQITDILTLPGGDVVIDLNTANIQSVVGSRIGDTLYTQDFNSWTPTAIPEPSSYGIVMGVLLLAVAAFRRKKATTPQEQT